LRESFARANPWVHELVLAGSRGAARRDVPVFTVGLLAVAAFAVGWMVAVSGGDPALVRWMTQATYCLGVIAAFLAPTVGSAARLRLERHPLFPESLSTPLTARDHAAAMHGRVVSRLALAAAIGLVAWAAYALILVKGDRAPVADLRLSLLWPLLRGFGFLDQLARAPDWSRALYAACMLACAVNLAAGFYLRATLLAEHSQLAAGSRRDGGILTAVLIFAAMASLVARLAVFNALPFGGRWDFLGPRVSVPLALLALEGGFAAARFTLARRTWARIAWGSLQKSRALLFDAA
jgi:hypothetical protein